MAFHQRIARYLQSRADLHQLRLRKAMQVIDATHVRLDNKVLTNFCSNNYLGLTHHPAMIAAAREASDRLGVGAGAAGLLGGYSLEHQLAEEELATWKGQEAAVLLPSGYQANLTAVQTLAALGSFAGRGLAGGGLTREGLARGGLSRGGLAGKGSARIGSVARQSQADAGLQNDPDTRAGAASAAGQSQLDARMQGEPGDAASARSIAVVDDGPEQRSPLAATGTSDTATGGVRFIADKLVHASLLDAVAQTHCPLRTFPHNNLSRLAQLLEKGEPGELQVVLTESIFSMDGDQADLAGLAELKKKFGFVLLVDEAHATGVYGADGAGLVNSMGYRDLVDVSVVTLSKGLGLIGGAICACRGFCDAVINAGRGYIYSTSVPAMQAAVLRQAIQLCRQEPDRRRRLQDNISRVRGAISQMGLAVPEGSSPIVPVILGGAEQAMAAAQQLRDQGLLVMAVRPPTVAPGQSRLRITLSSEHTQCDIDQLIGGLSKLAMISPGYC